MKSKIIGFLKVIAVIAIPVILMLGLFRYMHNEDVAYQKQFAKEQAASKSKPVDDVYNGGWKYIGENLYKICDGPNLIYGYAAKAITVSPNDPECKK